MNNLKRLVLRNIACDNILKTIGQSCSCLEILDISHSSQVTDIGIKYLLLRYEVKDLNRQMNSSKSSLWHIIKTLSRYRNSN